MVESDADFPHKLRRLQKKSGAITSTLKFDMRRPRL